ncbi:deaminase [Streptomyces sp. 3MP-14]|uniref:Deaminase n=1 Tax=Streptomyces mimosae TaxID=2586635 RepID=A0A5N6AMN0_9ACTN|nr:MULTISPECIES: dihydrofolate reductase family protein [Streptomyces]KAB8168878.1 deaminase [Streptomyces mimosae]KAB8177843.1 deaminase [Streptomyces sp. 3MP-14]
MDTPEPHAAPFAAPPAGPPEAAGRPRVLLSCAASLDGFIDDRTERRLILSNAEDLDRVDAVRAASDAILVGAATVRADDPRLLVRSAERRAAREAAGLPADPARVVLTAGGQLDPHARVFTVGAERPLVYCPGERVPATAARLGEAATVVGAGDPLDLRRVLADLRGRGVCRLMVEGGSTVHTAFLAAGLVDELHLVIAPFLLGAVGSPRFTAPADFPQGPERPLRLAEARPLGDCVLLRYLVPPARGTAQPTPDTEGTPA